jgi:hypothetical protein
MELENIYFKTKFEEFIFYFDVIAHEFGEENFIERYKHFNELVTPLENEINETILNLNSKEHISFYLDKLTSELLGRISLYFFRFEGLKKEVESEKSTENEYKIHVFYLSLSSIKMVLDTLKRKFYLNNLDFEKVATQIISISEFNTINEFLYPNNNNTQNAVLLEPEPPIEKLKWIGTIAQFGFIINELATKGFIEFPQTHKELSISKLAKLCLNSFNIDTTKGTLENALNPEKPQYLPETKCKSFAIPNINDLK